MRTLVDIPDEDLERLDAIAAAGRRSRAAEIREAIRAHIAGKTSQDWIAQGAGYWKQRRDLGDGIDVQRAARAGRKGA